MGSLSRGELLGEARRAWPLAGLLLILVAVPLRADAAPLGEPPLGPILEQARQEWTSRVARGQGSAAAARLAQDVRTMSALEAALERATRDGDRPGEAVLAATLYHRLGGHDVEAALPMLYRAAKGAPSDATRACERGLAIAVADGNLRAEAGGLATQGNLLYWQGLDDQAGATFERALGPLARLEASSVGDGRRVGRQGGYLVETRSVTMLEAARDLLRPRGWRGEGARVSKGCLYPLRPHGSESLPPGTIPTSAPLPTRPPTSTPPTSAPSPGGEAPIPGAISRGNEGKAWENLPGTAEEAARVAALLRLRSMSRPTQSRLVWPAGLDSGNAEAA